MMDIGIDARMIAHTGIGTYLRGILNGARANRDPVSAQVGLFGNVAELRKKYGEYSAFSFKAPIYSVREQWEYPGLLKKCRIWHSPHYNVPFCAEKTNLVVTIHDLIHWLFRREYFSGLKSIYAGTMFRRAISQASQIITVSEHTKKDLVEQFRAPEAKITVIPEAVDAKFKKLAEDAVEQTLKSLNLRQPYFLYVGLMKPHKRVPWLVRNFRKLRRGKKIKADLVLVGKRDANRSAENSEMGELSREEGIIHLPFVTDEVLVALYNGATALVHPSKYEGFGLTLLEAMACDTPVVCCRVASIPEVVGDAAVLIPEDSEAALCEAFTELEKNSRLRAELIEKGRIQIRKFSWEKTAQRTFAVYRTLLQNEG